MVKITRVYTKRGDKGSTRVSKKECISKYSLNVEVLGSLDELNSFLGWGVVATEGANYVHLRTFLLNIQNKLFDVGAYICNQEQKELLALSLLKIVTLIEKDINHMNQFLPSLNSFVLPGGGELSARLHLARTVCRRTECKMVGLEEEFDISIVLPFINRLSDWLFVAARYALYKADVEEKLWVPLTLNNQ